MERKRNIHPGVGTKRPPQNITQILAGKVLESVWKNDNTLVIRMETGDEVWITWVDQNNNALNGRPAVVKYQRHVIAKPARIGAVGLGIR